MPSESLDFFDPLLADSGFEWEHPGGGVPGGVTEMILYRDSDGSHSRFLRVEPGVTIPPDGSAITHEFTEEVYVIGGRAMDQSRDVELRPGMYACHLPEHEHGPLDCHGGLFTFEVRYF